MPVPMNVPAGYEPVRGGRGAAFGLPAALDWIEARLAEGETLHAWAARHPERRELAGRGAVWSIPAPAQGPEGAERWVVRHYLRGGAVARWLDDRYLSVGEHRPVLEARAALEARTRGIPTPAVVCGAVYPAGPFYRADLVSEEIPGAADLAAVLFGQGHAGIAGPDALAAAGALVRTLEREGIDHPDLNAKNIVLQPGHPLPRAHLVDLDRCCPRVSGGPHPSHPMRRRLIRSLRKFERKTGQGLSAEAWAALHRAFAP